MSEILHFRMPMPVMSSANGKGSWNSFEFLVVMLMCSFLVWYLQWHWSRRKLYKLASKVPGPFPFPLLGSAHYFLGSPCQIYKNMQSIFLRYPGLCRMWFAHKLYYHVSDPKYLDIILNHPKALGKDRNIYTYFQSTIGLGIFTAPVDIWRKHRKIIRPTFNQKILDSFVPVFDEQAKILVKQLKKIVGKNDVDIYDLITRATLDTICETAMSVKSEAQTTDGKFGKWLDRVMEILFLRFCIILYRVDFLFYFTSYYSELEQLLKNIHGESERVVVEKRKAYEKNMIERKLCPEAEIYEEAGKRKAFLDYLIELTHSDPSRKMTDKELREEVDTFLVAGSDTTATTNCFICLTLGMHQDVQQKCFEEIMEVLGPEKSVEPEDLPKLKYLESVIKETLRLFPVGPFISRSLEEDIDLGDVILPAGSSAVIGIINVHRNDQYWPDPLKFDPDRFSADKTIVPGSYLPFALGPRMCIGPKYAMMAMKGFFAAVLRKYKIHTHHKSIEEVDLKMNIVLRPKDGFKIHIEERS